MFKYFCSLAVMAAVGLIGLEANAGKAAAAETCNLKQRASLPMVTMGPLGTGLIQAGIGGRPFRMLVDTGAESTMIEGKAALAAGLKLPRATGRAVGIGGEVDVSVLFLLPMLLDHTRVDALMAKVSDPEKPLYQNAFDGLLGLDVLDQFDFEIDPQGKKLNLYSQEHCRGQVVYWDTEYSTIPFALSQQHLIQVTVQVNGRPLRGIIDTGNSHTSMRWTTASDLFGLTTGSPGVYALPHPTMTGDGKLIDGAQYTFDSLEFGHVRIRHAVVNLLPQYSANAFSDIFGMDDWGPQIIIGMDVLQHLRFYVANAEKMIYFTVVPPAADPPASPS